MIPDHDEIKKYFDEVTVSMKDVGFSSKSDLYEKIPPLTKESLESLLACLEGLPEQREYTVPVFTHTSFSYHETKWLSKSNILQFIISTIALYDRLTEPVILDFKEIAPSIYHALCVEFSKVPLLLNDSQYEPLVLKWRLERGI
jgi:hypothetical protein